MKTRNERRKITGKQQTNHKQRDISEYWWHRVRFTLPLKASPGTDLNPFLISHYSHSWNRRRTWAWVCVETWVPGVLLCGSSVEPVFRCWFCFDCFFLYFYAVLGIFCECFLVCCFVYYLWVFFAFCLFWCYCLLFRCYYCLMLFVFVCVYVFVLVLCDLVLVHCDLSWLLYIKILFWLLCRYCLL